MNLMNLMTDYRSFFGLDSRLTIWIIAQIHLMFGAFVLGVPIFAVIIEIVGIRTKEIRYDRLAKEFTKLLSVAYATTAALGGLMVFSLFGLYPTFMRYMTGVFDRSMYLYALMFFGETFMLYLYYYSWDKLQGGKKKKWLHVSFGVLLNIFGALIMVIANSWASFMMAPGIGRAVTESGELISGWRAFFNPLSNPLNIHRFLANIAFGGFVAGAYAAIKFLAAKTEEEKAHYDWMGYVGNFVGIAALIFLPFAGYYLGREVYSQSAVMGNIMMGGAFSWTFILQAILVGTLFIGANYYLWLGMQRIPGSERYLRYIKYLNAILLICFAIWLTPHNLPLSSEEQIIMGGQYHPVLKYLGLMSGKNAAVNFIIVSTFLSFLLYRRANKGKTFPFSQQGAGAKVALIIMALLCMSFLAAYANRLLTLDPKSLDLTQEKAKYFILPMLLLIVQVISLALATFLTFLNRGKLAQVIMLAITVICAVFILGVYGYIIMVKANPFLRSIAVTQFLLVLACLLFTGTIDIFLYRRAERIGDLVWGKMPVRSQYTLILLCVTVVMLMALMGYIRSGLREDWHIYGIMKDTSESSYTPSMSYMSKVIGLIVALFLSMVAFLFWLSGLGEKGEKKG